MFVEGIEKLTVVQVTDTPDRTKKEGRDYHKGLQTSKMSYKSVRKMKGK